MNSPASAWGSRRLAPGRASCWCTKNRPCRVPAPAKSNCGAVRLERRTTAGAAAWTWMRCCKASLARPERRTTTGAAAGTGVLGWTASANNLGLPAKRRQGPLWCAWEAPKRAGRVAARFSALRQLTRRACPNAANEVRGVSCATGHATEHWRAVGAKRRPPPSCAAAGLDSPLQQQTRHVNRRGRPRQPFAATGDHLIRFNNALPSSTKRRAASASLVLP